MGYHPYVHRTLAFLLMLIIPNMVPEYICPKCGTFNPSPKAKREQERKLNGDSSLHSSVGPSRTSESPTSPSQPLPKSTEKARAAEEIGNGSLESMDVDADT
jgi:hypothetical protein